MAVNFHDVKALVHDFFVDLDFVVMQVNKRNNLPKIHSSVHGKQGIVNLSILSVCYVHSVRACILFPFTYGTIDFSLTGTL